LQHRAVVAFALTGQCEGIERSLRSNRAVVAAQSCGRCSPIVQSFFFALTSQCEEIMQSSRQGFQKARELFKKRFGLSDKRLRRMKENVPAFFPFPFSAKNPYLCEE
jgi:hypothetical protein